MQQKNPDALLDNNTKTESRSIGYLIIAGVVAILLATVLLGTKSTFADAIHYTITYDSGVVNNMPTDQDTKTLAETVPISATTPTRTGFNFLGWCSQVPTSSGGANLDICGGGTYIPNSDWTINQTSTTNNLHLYAMWGEPTLYDNVASMSKGKQTVADIQTDITVPTSADRAEDTSNSGVYEYDPSVFGVASDATDDHTIYYYRGVLENTVGSYGSDGSAVTYPNYVVLSTASDKTGLANTDTCWRIVRTTGSGGVKMIYNGKWTGSTCANTQSNAQVTTKVFNGTTSDYRQIVRVGYTYNSTYATNTASTASIGNVLGTNSNPGANGASSNMKTYIEGTWFSNISSYESMLEPSAGYCNDRTVYDDTSPYTLQSEDTNIVTYGTSSMTLLRFGSNIRNNFALSANNNRTLTLNCARNVVDLYTTNSATDGNKQLSKPAALLTADEVAFAGSGTMTATQGSAYNANSYLRSGSDFWLLSPYHRLSNGYACEFSLYSNGFLSYNDVPSARGVRPAISLTSGTTATSGAGIATDPWIVNPQ